MAVTEVPSHSGILLHKIIKGCEESALLNCILPWSIRSNQHKKKKKILLIEGFHFRKSSHTRNSYKLKLSPMATWDGIFVLAMPCVLFINCFSLHIDGSTSIYSLCSQLQVLTISPFYLFP